MCLRSQCECVCVLALTHFSVTQNNHLQNHAVLTVRAATSALRRGVEGKGGKERRGVWQLRLWQRETRVSLCVATETVAYHHVKTNL